MKNTGKQKQETKVVHPVFMDSLDDEITTRAENLFEDLVENEGFSEEQANAIALTELERNEPEDDELEIQTTNQKLPQ